MPSINKLTLACSLTGVLAVAGCGSSSSGSKTTASQRSSSSTTKASGGSSTPGGGALAADAHSAATGDIPDNQVFLLFTNKAAGYAIKYPEGWTQSGSGRSVTFRDKNNLVRVVVGSGSSPTPSSVASQLNTLKQSNRTLRFHSPQKITIGSSPAVKAVYTTESAPNPVTGKRVLLIVDRYELHRGGVLATVDLGTPKGVDNVDAYRMMIQSFRWL